jgi:DNA-binding transcriptional regulator YhcF (GntR family)
MRKNLLDLITVDNSLAVPIYKQIVDSICKGIDNGYLHQNDKLPSVNGIAERFALARGSVFTAYNELRGSGIIDSIPGKGYFITSTQTKVSQNVFLLFNRFDPYKEALYNSISENLPAAGKLDIFFHHHDKKIFETLLREEASYYNNFVIMPENDEHSLTALSVLNPKQVLLIDVGYKQFKKYYAGVYQNSDKDIYSFLIQQKDRLLKYKRLFLVAPRENRMKETISGFTRFGRTGIILTDVINTLNEVTIKKGDAYIVTDDEHLIELVTCSKTFNWQPGKDVGILSYNETPLKSVIAGGISTVSPDYVAMGKSIAAMLASGDRSVIENPFVMVNRESF